MLDNKTNEWQENPYFDLLTDLNKLNDKDSFTVARVINGINCVELHYNEGKATIEYGTRINEDEWENDFEDIDWFDKDMSEEELSNKLWYLFDYKYRYSSKVYTVCHDILRIFNTKDDAKKFYSDCYYMSEGAEHERYASILVDLNFSNLGKDNISINCYEISIQMTNNEFLSVKLDDSLSIDDTIKYYEEKISPILEISEDYGVDFTNHTPFEDFGLDSESYTNTSFSSYYEDLLKKFGIEIDSIQTESRSDGKYTITINDKEFDIVAWDDLQGVVENIETMINSLQKDKEIEI